MSQPIATKEKSFLPKMLTHLSYSYDPFLVIILLGTTLLYLLGNGNLAITDPVESNYALTAKEMVLAGNWLSPQIFAHYWFDKPIFFYLELVVAYKLFGISDFSTRLFPSLFGVANIYLIYSFTKRVMTRQIARIAAMMMAVSAEAWFFSKAAITDSTLVFFFSATLFSFYLGYEKRKTYGSSRSYYYIAYIASAFAVLTKGPIGFFLPAFIIFLFLLVRRDVKELRHLQLLPGFLIVGLIGGSWYLYMYIAHGDAFIRTFLGVHNWLRATVSEHPRDNVWYYYLLVNIIALIPWTPMVIMKAFKYRKDISWKDPRLQFLGIWALIVILFFQAMATKYMTYTFPALMPIIMLSAYWWRHNISLIRKITIVTTITYIILTVAIAMPLTKQKSDPIIANYISHYTLTPNTLVLDSRKTYHVSTTFYSGKTVYKLKTNEDATKGASEHANETVSDSTQPIIKKDTNVDPNKLPLSWDVKNMMPTIHTSQLPSDKTLVLITDNHNFPNELFDTHWSLLYKGPEGNIYVKDANTSTLKLIN